MRRTGTFCVVIRTTSIVAKVATDAKRAVLAALAGGVIAIVALEGAHERYRLQNDAATDRLLEIRAAMDRVLILQSRLDMHANMAAATGEESWIGYYDETLSGLDAAMGDAVRYARPVVAWRFQTETGRSQKKVVELDRLAFAAVRAGDLAKARAMLADSHYQYNRTVIEDGTERFIEAVTSDVREELDLWHRQELLVVGSSFLIVSLAAFVLWRRLTRSLSETESIHKDAEEKIKRLAMNDVLTGLANRLSFHDGLKAAIARADAGSTKLAVLMIDLDRFKPINDRYGHLVGDIVLKEVAERIRSVGRRGEIQARFGGDEFVALVEYSGNDGIPAKVGERLVERLSEPIRCQGLSLDVGASVGFAVYPNDGTEDETLIAKADIALYRAKRDGRGLVRRFDASMDEDRKALAELEADVEQAIKSKSITPYFQPLVDLSTGTVIGFEVLARWHHPTKGHVDPATFIRIAEKSSLIDELSLSLLNRACLDMRALPPHLTIALNLSPRQLQDDRMAHRILAVLSKTRFPPSRLEIEITESTLINDLEAARSVIGTFKSLGIKVALDDFGTGYSSLSYLSELHFDKIKIDRSFIRTIHDRQESRKVVAAIVGLGRSLGVPIIAEGIETQRDEEAVRAMGCPIGQGFFYSQAVPAMDVPALLGKTFGTFDTAPEPAVA